MDLKRLGHAVRALRRRRGWRQSDLAAAARLSRTVLGRIERGQGEAASVAVLERVVASLGGTLAIEARWQGEGLDRLLDEGHARLVERIVAHLRALGWEVAVEVSFSRYGERGSVDVLAWHRTHHALAVIEVKSVRPDMQAMLVGLDRKVRLGPWIASQRGWAPVRSVARILVLADTSTNRRRLARFGSMVDAVLPAGTWKVRRWLETPDGAALAGVWFLADDHDTARIADRRRRIRAPSVHASRGPPRFRHVTMWLAGIRECFG